jgi:hypothetical protein
MAGIILITVVCSEGEDEAKRLCSRVCNMIAVFINIWMYILLSRLGPSRWNNDRKKKLCKHLSVGMHDEDSWVATLTATFH